MERQKLIMKKNSFSAALFSKFVTNFDHIHSLATKKFMPAFVSNEKKLFAYFSLRNSPARKECSKWKQIRKSFAKNSELGFIYWVIRGINHENVGFYVQLTLFWLSNNHLFWRSCWQWYFCENVQHSESFLKFLSVQKLGCSFRVGRHSEASEKVLKGWLQG